MLESFSREFVLPTIVGDLTCYRRVNWLICPLSFEGHSFFEPQRNLRKVVQTGLFLDIVGLMQANPLLLAVRISACVCSWDAQVAMLRSQFYESTNVKRERERARE